MTFCAKDQIVSKADFVNFVAARSSLFDRGLNRSNALNFGIDALPNGSVVGQNGENSDVIFTLGTALKGTLWETTAIPEIRTQARHLAEVLLSD